MAKFDLDGATVETIGEELSKLNKIHKNAKETVEDLKRSRDKVTDCYYDAKDRSSKIRDEIVGLSWIEKKMRKAGIIKIKIDEKGYIQWIKPKE